MSRRACLQEPAVHAAAASGRWPTVLRQHTSLCDDCRDSVLVVEALREPLAPRPVETDPRMLWLAARHASHLRAEGQMSLVVTAGQMAAIALVCAVLVRAAPWADVWRSWYAARLVEFGVADWPLTATAVAGAAVTLALARRLSRDA